MNFSTRLDQAMTRAGFKSQSALARASGVSQTTINRLLKTIGKGGPETVTVRKLADACGVDFEWLFNGTQNNKPAKICDINKFALVYVTEAELRILTKYREASPAGQSLLQQMATDLPQRSTPALNGDTVDDKP